MKRFFILPILVLFIGAFHAGFWEGQFKAIDRMGVAFADEGSNVTAEIISQDLDDNGNIRVWTQYKIDNIEVKSQYPKIDGKFVYATRYHILNFVGMTDTEIKARIQQDVETHAETLIRKTFIKKANQDILDSHLSDVVGTKVIKETTTIKVSEDKEWELKTDGTYVEKSITP